jgi:ribonucleoside-diphosphate reductase beta chain
LVKAIAVFSAFTEGLQLYASFAILLNFQRFNKLRGMGQIVAWSSRDECHHVETMMYILQIILDEHPHVWDAKMVQDIKDICQRIVDNEDRFVDLAFEFGPVEGLSAPEIKQYIRYQADYRLRQLGIAEGMFNVTENPLSPWIDSAMNAVEHSNFFEVRSTEYSRASTLGSWDDAF